MLRAAWFGRRATLSTVSAFPALSAISTVSAVLRAAVRDAQAVCACSVQAASALHVEQLFVVGTLLVEQFERQFLEFEAIGKQLVEFKKCFIELERRLQQQQWYGLVQFL